MMCLSLPLLWKNKDEPVQSILGRVHAICDRNVLLSNISCVWLGFFQKKITFVILKCLFWILKKKSFFTLNEKLLGLVLSKTIFYKNKEVIRSS